MLVKNDSAQNTFLFPSSFKRTTVLWNKKCNMLYESKHSCTLNRCLQNHVNTIWDNSGIATVAINRRKDIFPKRIKLHQTLTACVQAYRSSVWMQYYLKPELIFQHVPSFGLTINKMLKSRLSWTVDNNCEERHINERQGNFLQCYAGIYLRKLG
jgi:hypothetical protein